MKLKRDAKEVLGTIGVDFQGGFRIRQIQFPYIVKEQVHNFDSLMMSSAWGDNIPRPVQTIRQQCHGERPGYDYIIFGETISIYKCALFY